MPPANPRFVGESTTVVSIALATPVAWERATDALSSSLLLSSSTSSNDGYRSSARLARNSGMSSAEL